jgi:hypothetical protein
MKKFAKTFCIVSVVSLFLFWIAWGLLMAVLPPISLWQFFGFTQSPPPSFWQSFFMLLFEVLSMPMSLMYELVGHDGSRFVFALLSLVNSVVWGLCIGFPIYAVKRRYFTHAA